MNEGKYIPIDYIDKKMEPLEMDYQAIFAQIDMCGRMVSFVNEYAEINSAREHLNRAVYELRQAYIAVQEAKNKEQK